MSRESLGYVRLEWTCPSCGSRNPGPQRTCQNCGTPQPENVAFVQAEQQELLQDAGEVAAAKAAAEAGADYHCAFCGARNPAGTETCSQCGADLKAGVRREAGQVVGAFTTGPAKIVACPSCGAENVEGAHNCVQCGAALAGPARPQTAAPEAKKAGFPWLAVAIGLVVLVCIVGAVWMAVLAGRTEGKAGVVSGVFWQRSVAVEALQPVNKSAWLDEIPEEAVMGQCESREHHIQDEPAEDAVKECGTPYTLDQGSGYGEVVQDCKYHVYEDYCQYQVDEWQTVETKTLEGSDPALALSVQWPEPQLDSNERLGERQELYRVDFDVDGETFEYETSDYELFKRCQPGTEWTLMVNTFGNVVEIEPQP